VENARSKERNERPGFGVTVALEADQLERIARRAAEIAVAMLTPAPAPASPYLSIPEAAALLRARRQRVDDLLSQGRLTRVKDGARTLVRRAELEAYLRGEPTDRGAGRGRARRADARREPGMRSRASRED
jgi:excisionase family DNA binding protein